MKTKLAVSTGWGPFARGWGGWVFSDQDPFPTPPSPLRSVKRYKRSDPRFRMGEGSEKIKKDQKIFTEDQKKCKQ